MSVLTQILMRGALDAQSLRDIKPPVEVSQSLLPYLIGGVVILGFVVILALYYIRKHRQVQLVPVTEVDDAPLAHEVAYEKLAEIEAADWLSHGDMETYHTQVAYVLREYIRARYSIPALELTTTALLHAMLKAQIDASYVERVRQLLANCDKVKFATYQPELTEASARVADARWIVDATKSSVL